MYNFLSLSIICVGMGKWVYEWYNLCVWTHSGSRSNCPGAEGTVQCCWRYREEVHTDMGNGNRIWCKKNIQQGMLTFVSEGKVFKNIIDLMAWEVSRLHCVFLFVVSCVCSYLGMISNTCYQWKPFGRKDDHLILWISIIYLTQVSVYTCLSICLHLHQCHNTFECTIKIFLWNFFCFCWILKKILCYGH